MNITKRNSQEWLVVLFALLCSACATRPLYQVNEDHRSVSIDERVKYIILHYTNETEKNSLSILTKGEVSSHYLIGQASQNGNKPIIYQFVPENKRAWHAGKSAWKDRTNLNDISIGIEIVNMGCNEQNLQKDTCDPYQVEQIEALIVLLKDLQKRYHISPENILGHSDIAPFRKTDPGPLFPWQQLAENGLVMWPKQEHVAYYLKGKNPKERVNVARLQRLLKEFGYTETPQNGRLDKKTKRILQIFQVHFRNTDISGNPDRETLAILQALLMEEQDI